MTIAACGSFDRAEDVPSATVDGGAADVSTAIDAAASGDGGGGDADADAATASFECDAFDRAHPVEGSTLWASVGGNSPPTIAAGLLELGATSSETIPGLLRSKLWPRGDTVTVRAKVTVLEPQLWIGFAGRLELFTIDASPTDVGKEEAILAYNGQNLIVIYRAFPSGSLEVIPLAHAWGASELVVFTARFHPTEGFMAVSVDGIQLINERNLATAPVPATETSWQLTVGVAPRGATPIAKAQVDDLCVSR